jgi:hypothetical protein
MGRGGEKIDGAGSIKAPKTVLNRMKRIFSPPHIRHPSRIDHKFFGKNDPTPGSDQQHFFE